MHRDGFQGKDALNYAVNLGFDALSGLTGAGGKTAKIMKNFPTMAKVLQKAIKAGAIVFTYFSFSRFTFVYLPT